MGRPELRAEGRPADPRSGGSSSLFSFYLASKGFRVTTVDLQRTLVDNANHVAREMGWDLNNCVMDMKQLRFEDRFDHITSICVYEHIPMFDRVEINKKIRELLGPRAIPASRSTTGIRRDSPGSILPTT